MGYMFPNPCQMEMDGESFPVTDMLNCGDTHRRVLMITEGLAGQKIRRTTPGLKSHRSCRAVLAMVRYCAGLEQGPR
jgi:hypothetical protein